MPIEFNETKNLYSISGKKTQYIFAINHLGLIKHLYWGTKTSCLDDFDAGFTMEKSTNDPGFEVTPEEYSPWGGLRYKEPALKVIFSDGTRDLVLKFVDHEITKDSLYINLSDEHYPINVKLCYKLYEDLDIIERWTELENTGDENIRLEQVLSAEFNFDRIGFRQSNVYGYWVTEQKEYQEELTYGKKVLEGRRGNTGHNHNPSFIIDEKADENSGNVYFGTLGFSGNFKVVFETTQYDTTRVLLGLNDFDFSWNLKGKESFHTPKVYCGFTSEGFGEMSRILHKFSINNILPESHRNELKPVLYNSWEATYFDFTIEDQMALAEKAAAMGTELFVVDDGWFGHRNSDNAGLGDWTINKDKFPDGLEPLINKVKSLGMDFGIWVELEMVNPDSDLYRNHPDWIYNFKNRTPTESRNQLVLNLCNPDVVNYLKKVMRDLLSKHDIQFVKWDFNRPFSEPGALNLSIDDQQSIWYRHTEAVYDIVDTLKSEYPQVSFEACASGGGRIDYGAMEHFDQFWTSDNTDASDRLEIQHGYSYLYPIKAMRAWVTDCPNFLNKRSHPLKYRFHCAMMGTLGIGGNLNQWNQDEIDEAAVLIEEYKEIRHIVQEGQLYRLSHIDSGLHAVQYNYNEESLVFVYTKAERFGKELFTLKLDGLEKENRYRILIDGFGYDKSGEFLMKMGMTIHLPGDYSSKIIQVFKI